MIQYYIQTPIGQEGPFTLEALRKANINSQTPVWYEGISEWTSAGKIEGLKSILSETGSPPPFNNFEPPRYTASASIAEERKSGFKLSLFHWTGIGILVIAAFMYFSKQGDASPSSNYGATGLIDSTLDVVNDADTERQRINAQITAKNTNYRNNWSRFIKVAAGAHKYSPLGGIYDLEAVVQNQTRYPLDEVAVSISYIKDNGGTHKTEYVTIYNVPANGKASMPAPDSDRGTSVKLEITQIISKKMHFLYSPDIAVEGKDDPYFSRD